MTPGEARKATVERIQEYLKYALQTVTQQIAQAIQMALSKCAMVGVVGHSRLLARRLDVPTCAACDRPLINRRNPYRGPEPPDAPREDVSRPESSLAFAVPSGEMDRVQFRGATRQERVDPLYAKQRDYQRENVRHKKERSDDAAHRPRTVVRGGFRMPQGLGLSEEQAKYSWNVLSNYGNMLSPSVMVTSSGKEGLLTRRTPSGGPLAGPGPRIMM